MPAHHTLSKQASGSRLTSTVGDGICLCDCILCSIIIPILQCLSKLQGHTLSQDLYHRRPALELQVSRLGSQRLDLAIDKQYHKKDQQLQAARGDRTSGAAAVLPPAIATALAIDLAFAPLPTAVLLAWATAFDEAPCV